jgi:hypothetical protein
VTGTRSERPRVSPWWSLAPLAGAIVFTLMALRGDDAVATVAFGVVAVTQAVSAVLGLRHARRAHP